MKTRILASLVAVGALASSAFSGETLRVCADSWMPFNGDPKSATPGYVVELLWEVFEPRGVSVDYSNRAWTECLEAAKAGSIEAVIGANPTEAEGLVLGSRSVGMPRMGLFVLKDVKWTFTGVSSLKDAKLAVIDGYSYWPALDDYIRGAGADRVRVVSGDEPLLECIQLLDTGAVDVVAETFPVFIWTAKSSGRSVQAYRVAYKQEGEPIYVAFAPNDAGRKHAATLDVGIDELRASGRLAAILKKYNLRDWAEDE